jgi:hypothetical protein
MKYFCTYCKQTGEIRYAESHDAEDKRYCELRAESMYLQALMDSTPDETWVGYAGDEPYIHQAAPE